MSKTNFMIIKSTRKKDMSVNIQIRNSDGTSHPLVRKNHIKYLGVMIDNCVSWKYHIWYICSQINLEEYQHYISKLRHYLSIKQLKQIYYKLIYPYIAYAILAWGSTYISSLQKVQVKQNHVARLIFFANIRGKDTESALPLLNLLDMLTAYNIYSLHVLKFAHLWHKGLLPDVFLTLSVC